MAHRAFFRAGLSLAALASASVHAQDIPQSDPAFTGTIGTNLATSQTDFPKRPEAPAGAPNILIILLDDVGFAQFGTFGGLTPTPALDKLAAEGIRYNRFHTTALCSPTRAAMLTGRNAHNCGTGIITELATGFPGYNGNIPKSCGTIARTLSEHGYATAMFGKNHNTPAPDTSAAGPFALWPTGLGFDYFFGFNGGDVSQWEPTLVENTRTTELRASEKGRHLTEVLVDRAIGWISEQKTIAPNRPFLAYMAPGATHAPHHVPPEWIAKFKGKFDMGWDAYRDQAFARQLKLGVIPKGTMLTPRPAALPAWDSLSSDQKRLYAHMMEVFAGFTAHTDFEMGRMIAALDKMGQRENTLIFYVVGDNGASGEGGLSGNLNELAVFNGVPSNFDASLKAIDELGSAKHFSHFPAGWAWAMSTPFQWMKQVASHFGGTRNPLVVSWPKGIADKGSLRSQFHHISDITPTILEAARITTPEKVDGIAQKPLDGVSMAYSFPAAAKNAPDRKTRQIFELFVNRAIYDKGWVAASKYITPWELIPKIASPDETAWELYHIDGDFSESKDLAAEQPERLKAMKALWYEEAASGQILPLDIRRAQRFAADRPSWATGRKQFIFGPDTRNLPSPVGPNLLNHSYKLSAILEAAPDASGVIVAQGGNEGGWSLHAVKGVPTFSYNFLGIRSFAVPATAAFKVGPNNLVMDFVSDGAGLGKGATIRFTLNGLPAGEGRIERSVPLLLPLIDGFDVGTDLGSSVVPAYSSNPGFTGKITTVTFDVK
jgi:arylsulfatase A-like enzyme